MPNSSKHTKLRSTYSSKPTTSNYHPQKTDSNNNLTPPQITTSGTTKPTKSWNRSLETVHTKAAQHGMPNKHLLKHNLNRS